MNKKTLILLALAVPVLTMGAGCTAQKVSNQTNFGYTTSSSETDVSYPFVEFTAVYDAVSIFDEGFGGNLVSIDPDTKYMQEEMFRKVVFFAPGTVEYLNGKSIGGTKFIGIDKSVNITQEKHIVLPKSQRLKIKGIYHKEQHRPYAQVVESIGNTVFENENYTFEYPQAYEIKQKTQPVRVIVEAKKGKLEIFQLKSSNGERITEIDRPDEFDVVGPTPLQKMKVVENKQTWFDVWMYYDTNNKQTEDELMAIFDSIKLK